MTGVSSGRSYVRLSLVGAPLLEPVISPENRSFRRQDLGTFACRKMLHVLWGWSEFQQDGVGANDELGAIGDDASFACFRAYAASVRSELRPNPIALRIVPTCAEAVRRGR